MKNEFHFLINLCYDNETLEYESVPVYKFHYFNKAINSSTIIYNRIVNFEIDFDAYITWNEQTKEFVKEQLELNYE